MMQKMKMLRQVTFPNLEAQSLCKTTGRQLDELKYPTMISFVSCLERHHPYIKVDFDWKCIVFNFIKNNFVTVKHNDPLPVMPTGISDYCYFFGSNQTGWATDRTINIVIVTNLKLRYLTALHKNITLFVAQNQNTTVYYLLEYIRQCLNLDFTTKALPEEEIAIISNHLYFMGKLSDRTNYKASSFDQATKLIDVRRLINQSFTEESQEVDFICYLKHPKSPIFTNYRTKTPLLGGGVEPIEQHIEAIKCSFSNFMNFLLKQTIGPRLLHVNEIRSTVEGRSLTFFQPLYLLIDVATLGSTVFNPKQSINLQYLTNQTKLLNTGLSGQYRLKGLICSEDGISFYPIAVKSNGLTGKSFKDSNSYELDLNFLKDSLIKFVYLERENNSI